MTFYNVSKLSVDIEKIFQAIFFHFNSKMYFRQRNGLSTNERKEHMWYVNRNWRLYE